MKVQVTLTLDLAYPLKEIGRMNLRHHIAEAALIWGRSLHPDDCLFDGILRVNTSGLRIINGKSK